jgi:hypothetical protein
MDAPSLEFALATYGLRVFSLGVQKYALFRDKH